MARSASSSRTGVQDEEAPRLPLTFAHEHVPGPDQPPLECAGHLLEFGDPQRAEEVDRADPLDEVQMLRDVGVHAGDVAPRGGHHEQRERAPQDHRRPRSERCDREREKQRARGHRPVLERLVDRNDA